MDVAFRAQECDSPCVVVDGLWMVMLACLCVGVLWYKLAESPFVGLANLPLNAWQIVTDFH